MTDPTNDLERAERIRRLQERRSASARAPRATTTGTARGPAPRSGRVKTRKPHPAAATRWLLGGLSVASFFTIAGAVGVASFDAGSATGQPAVPTSSAGSASTSTPTPQPATPAALPAPAPVATSSAPIRVAAPAPAPAPAPHTTSRGS